MKTSKSLSSQATNYFIGRAIALGLHFIVPIILVRVFVKSDFGQFAQFLLIYEFLFRVLQFGLRHSVFYFIPSDKPNKAYYLANTLLIYFLIGVLCLIFLLLLKDDIADLFSAAEIAELLPLCGVHIIFMLITCPFEPFLISEKKAGLASIIVIGSQIVRGFFVIILVLIFNTVFSAAVGLIFYSFIRLVYYVYFLFKVKGFKIGRQSFSLMKQQFQYAMPIGFSGMISNIYKKIDKFILSMFFSPEIFAVYRIGNFKIPFIQLLFQSVGEVTLPRAVEMLKEKNIEVFLGLWRRLLTVFSFVGIGAFFLSQVIAYDIMTLMFTDEYASSVPIFRVFLFLLLGEMTQYGIVLRSIGNTKSIFMSNFLAFIISVPATYFLVKEFGPMGAAIAALAGFMINVIAQQVYSLIELKTKISEFFPLAAMIKMTLLSAVLSVTLYFLQDYIEYKIIRVLFSSIIFTTVYVVICWKANIYNFFEEKVVKKLIKKFV